MSDNSELGNIRYFVDHEQKILFAERFDSLDKNKIYAEWQAIKLLEGFDSAYDTVVDYSHTTSVDLDVADIMEINHKISDLDPRTGHVAIVAGLNDGRILLGRFFCKLANLVSKRKHQIFTTRAEAEAWLFSLRDP